MRGTAISRLRGSSAAAIVLTVFAVLSFFITTTGLTREAFAALKSDISITVSPVKNLLELEPGEEYDGEFKILNTGMKDFVFTVSVSPYSFADENYTSDMNSENSYTQISRWITFDKEEYYLKSGEHEIVAYHVSVPKDVPLGGQYAVILAQTGNADSGSISTLQRVGLLVFARIDGGDIRKEGKVLSIDIPQLFVSRPIKTDTLIENTGNVDFDIKHSLKIRTLFGKEVYSASKDYTLLPDTKRRVIEVWEDAPGFGVFIVTQEMETLGDIQSYSKLVLAIPLFVVIFLPIVLFAIALTIALHFKKRKHGLGKLSR